MKQQTSLLSFVADALTAWDGIVEMDQTQLHCLLPSQLAQQFALEEDATIALPSAEAGIPLIYGESLLDNLIEWVQDEGRCAQVELRDIHARSGGLRGELQQTVKLRNATGEIKNIQPSTCNYLVFHYRFEVQCHELRQGHEGVIALNEETLVEAPWLVPFLQTKHVKNSSSMPWRTSFDELLPTLNQRIEEHVQKALLPFVEQIEQRISRERRRLERQHRRERKQILKPLLKDPSLDQTEALQALKAAEEAYLSAITPLPAKFPISAQVEPYAAVRVSMPVTRIDYPIRQRKETRDIHWYWNPIIEGFEPRRCESCGQETFQFTANEALALFCHRCAGNSSS